MGALFGKGRNKGKGAIGRGRAVREKGVNFVKSQ